MTETEPAQQHYVRVVPTAGGDWISVCSDCDFEATSHDRIDAMVESDLHVNPKRTDGSGHRTTGRTRRRRR